MDKISLKQKNKNFITLKQCTEIRTKYLITVIRSSITLMPSYKNTMYKFEMFIHILKGTINPESTRVRWRLTGRVNLRQAKRSTVRLKVKHCVFFLVLLSFFTSDCQSFAVYSSHTLLHQVLIVCFNQDIKQTSALSSL